MTGMIEEFFGFEIFDSRIFVGGKIWQGSFLVSFILVSRNFGVYVKLKTCGSAMV